MISSDEEEPFKVPVFGGKKSNPPPVPVKLPGVAVKKEKPDPLEGGPKVVLPGSAGGSANAGISNAGAAVEARWENFSWYKKQHDLNLVAQKAAETAGAGGSAVDPVQPKVDPVDHGETTEESSEEDGRPLKRRRRRMGGP